MCILCEIRAKTLEEIEKGGKSAVPLRRALSFFDRLNLDDVGKQAVEMAEKAEVSGDPDNLARYYSAALMTGISTGTMATLSPVYETITALRESYKPFAALMVKYQHDIERTNELAPAFEPLNRLIRKAVDEVLDRSLSKFEAGRIPRDVVNGKRPVTPDEIEQVAQFAEELDGRAFKLAVTTYRATFNVDDTTARIRTTTSVIEHAINDHAELKAESVKYIRGEDCNFINLAAEYQ